MRQCLGGARGRASGPLPRLRYYTAHLAFCLIALRVSKSGTMHGGSCQLSYRAKRFTLLLWTIARTVMPLGASSYRMMCDPCS